MAGSRTPGVVSSDAGRMSGREIDGAICAAAIADVTMAGVLDAPLPALGGGLAAVLFLDRALRALRR